MTETSVGFHFTSLPGAEEVGNFEYSYLVCHLDDRLFGLPTKEVQEIIPLPQLMRIPQLPECMLGLTRYRDEIIPVLDLRKLYAKHLSEWAPAEQMVVINHGRRLCGVALHDISEILNFSSEEIEPMPSVSALQNDEFYLGVKRMNERIVTLLDIGAILDFAHIPTRSELKDSQLDSGTSTISRVSVIRLGDIKIGIDIRQIDRITRVPEILTMNDAPSCVRGKALRDGVDPNCAKDKDYYPIVDLYAVMNAPEDLGKRTVIMSSGGSIGFYTGQVDAILDIRADELVTVPELVRTSGNQYVKNVIRTSDDLVLLLDLPQILHTCRLVS